MAKWTNPNEHKCTNAIKKCVPYNHNLHQAGTAWYSHLSWVYEAKLGLLPDICMYLTTVSMWGAISGLMAGSTASWTE